MVRTILAVMFCLLFTSAVEAQAQSLNLMPLPAKVQMGSGQLVVDANFSVSIAGHHEARLDRTVELFLTQLRRQTGMPPLDMKVTDSATATLVIEAAAGTKAVQELGEDESYKLEIASSGARLNAPTTLGVMRGLQTFLQLVRTTSAGFAVPAVSIEDSPRFPWRGLMIDVGRHFIPLDVLKRNLDGMAAVKLNVFHWHLSENQGFRVESKKFPKLTGMGSDGLYYTQAEVRELIAYARERGIRVVPEFDMPGHATAWFVGYPELASGPGPYQIERQWGVFDPAMDPTREETYKFLDIFIGEMAGLFPDEFFHIGGDEVNGKEWDANPKIQAFMRAHGMKNNNDLQAYFNQRVEKIVAKHGKTMLGWDEILRPDLPKTIVIQSWRGPDSLARAAKLGYRGLLSSGYYVDLMWSAERHYATEPLSGAAASLTPEEQKRILGGEACMWSEYVSPENIDSRIWPRTAAIAERLWSPRGRARRELHVPAPGGDEHVARRTRLDPQFQLRPHAAPHCRDKRHRRPESSDRCARAGEGLHSRRNRARARHQPFAAESRSGCGASGKRHRPAVCRRRGRNAWRKRKTGLRGPGQGVTQTLARPTG